MINADELRNECNNFYEILKIYYTDGLYETICVANGILEANDYCAYGERRET